MTMMKKLHLMWMRSVSARIPIQRIYCWALLWVRAYSGQKGHTQTAALSTTHHHLWVDLTGDRTPTTNKSKPCFQQTMTICSQHQWNAIVWTSHGVGWPHWRKREDYDQLPDRRGRVSRVSGTSALTKADWNSPSTAYPQPNKRHSLRWKWSCH